MNSRPRTFWRLSRRRLCGLMMLMSVCASVLPIPLPAPTTSPKDVSVPFPCQNRPCGCRSAEQCWKKCCCFTNPQKIAWAKAHGVTAPDYVYAAVNQPTTSETCGKSCCRSHEAAKSSDHSAPQTPKCCATKTTVKQPESSAQTDYVLGVLAEQCRGQSSFWNWLPWAVIPEPIILNLCTAIATAKDGSTCILPSISYQPPAPPPRSSAAFTL